MESFKEIGRQFSAINMVEEYRRSLDSIQNIAKSLMSVSTIDTARSIQNFQESMKIFTESVIAEQISQLKSIDYSKIFSQTLKKTVLLKMLSMQRMNFFKKNRTSKKMLNWKQTLQVNRKFKTQ